jgi:hypothetical protein
MKLFLGLALTPLPGMLILDDAKFSLRLQTFPTGVVFPIFLPERDAITRSIRWGFKRWDGAGIQDLTYDSAVGRRKCHLPITLIRLGSHARSQTHYQPHHMPLHTILSFREFGRMLLQHKAL